jgi:transposase
MKSAQYVEILRDMFDECATRSPDRSFILYQDRAPCHTAKNTSEYIAQRGISTVDPPGVSPDANPIENCWTCLSRIVYKDTPSFQTKAELKEAIKKAWEKIDQSTINNLCMSVQRRLFSIYEANGGCTKY